MLITSNRSVAEWGTVFADPVFATAILDRLLHHSHVPTIRGDSYRLRAKRPTLSFKGIDNVSYYRLLPDQKRYHINDTGTGNTVNLSHQCVLQMVTDSLRYWVQDMHVDGFRFDLGTILAREPYGFDEGGRISRFLSPRPGAVIGQADYGALGLRTGRLSGRRLPSGMGGMERSLPRYDSLLLEGR